MKRPSPALVALAVVLGIFLIPFCLFHAWTGPTYPSIKPWPSGSPNGPARPRVDEWKWELLNIWYANTEDGVSGQYAWVWKNGKLVLYTSLFPVWIPKWVVAVAWSVWRNNANNLKRRLRNDTWSK